MVLSRIGLDYPNKEYKKIILSILALSQCIGMIGGRPNKALYFIGI